MKRRDFRSGINEAVKELNLSSEDFDSVNLHKYEEILVSVLNAFTSLGKRGLSYYWWWQHFKATRFSVQSPDAWRHLEEIIEPLASPEETFWFIAEDDEGTKKHGNFWLFEGTTKAIVSVIGEMRAYEYYIVPKKLNWLLCETHHDVLIGVGDPIIKSMKATKLSDEHA
jgi:hypothetical protein